MSEITDADDTAAATADFCKRLRRNDPTITAITEQDLRHGFGRIGDALMSGSGNMQISSIFFHVEQLLDDVDETVGDVSSARLLELTMQHARPMLEYIRKSTALRTLFVEDGGQDYHIDYQRQLASLASQVYQAILDSHDRAGGSSIEHLSLRQWYMAELAQGTFTPLLPRISHLTIRVDNDDLNVGWFGNALRSNETLALEHLDIWGNEEQYPPVASLSTIVWSLVGHGRLQSLSLGLADIEGASLEALVGLLSQTQSLRSLKGGYYPSVMTEQDAAVFIGGLRSNGGSLTELGLGACGSEEFLDTLMAYFRSPGHAQNSLRVLDFRDELDRLAEAMVTPRSVGSALRVFKTDGYSPHFVHFINTVASQGSQNKLESLHLNHCHGNGTAALTNGLPYFVHLSELHLVTIRRGDDEERALVKALKRNGSLRKVTVEPELNNQYREQVTAVCQRNSQMPRLLGRRPNSSDVGAAEAAAVNGPQEANEAETAAGNHAIAATATTATRVKLVPSLFAAALDTPRMTPHMMLMGLGSSEQDIGY